MLLPLGARLQLEFITPEKEQELLQTLSKEPWYAALGRRVIHYGSMYRYFGSEPDRKVDSIPNWIPPITIGDKTMSDFFNQIIVNEYNPGQGIAQHTDHTAQFGDTIATLSLGSAIVMDLQSSNKKISLLLPRRSLLTLQGDARYKWKHGIAKRLHDTIPGTGTRIKREKRISITYRNDLEKRDEPKRQKISHEVITKPN